MGTAVSGNRDPLEIHQHKGFIIAIYTFPGFHGQYSAMAGIRKADAPIPQEPFPMSEQEFPTHEAATKAALEECMKKINGGFAA